MNREPDAMALPERGSAAWIQLPRAALPRDASLALALERRRTTRELATTPLALTTLAELLWAACGVNRAAGTGPFGLAGRTAASASNSQEVDVYVALAQGTYRYDPNRHGLARVSAEDLRRFALGGGQGDLGAHAPVRLVYVADVDRLVHTAGFQEPGLHDPDVQRSYYYVDCGLIAANVYLYAAASGLGAWFHHCDQETLARRLGLRPAQRVLFAQTVGHPAAG